MQLRYLRTTHTCILRAYFAYTRMSIRADMRVYIEDITCPRVDMNFIFEWSTRYLTSERIHIHKRACNVLFII